MKPTQQEDRDEEGLSLQDFLLETHRLIEMKEESSRITRPEMAARIGSTKRTYTEYLLGTVKPHPMRVLLQLLALLDDESIVFMVRKWAANNPIAPLNKNQNNVDEIDET